MQRKSRKYTPVIGLEVHVELKTASKMFCDCSGEHFGVDPNTHTCPVCLGLPGALPVPNKKAIEWCQLIGLALGCELALESKFDRKNYFYPDLPKGYQISQYDMPFCKKGVLSLSAGKKLRITRVHMEEDTGKLIHRQVNGKAVSLVDFNRSGVPLVEIVTEPDLRSAEEADEALKQIQQIIRYLEVSDCDMEKGSMRLEVNMSLTRIKNQESRIKEKNKSNPQPKTQDVKALPSYKVEIKNINSFRFVRKAIEYEFQRQAELLDKGERPSQETRGWSEDKNRTVSQRTKEEVHDYRYFPEPDIPPLRFDKAELEKLTKRLPELPQLKQERFQKKFELKARQAGLLTQTRELADYFEEAVRVGKKHRLEPQRLAKLIINKKVDIDRFQPAKLVKMLVKRQAERITDEKALKDKVEAAIKQNPQAVADYQSGKTQVIGVFVGTVMQATGGKADPQLVRKLLMQALKKD